MLAQKFPCSVLGRLLLLEHCHYCRSAWVEISKRTFSKNLGAGQDSATKTFATKPNSSCLTMKVTILLVVGALYISCVKNKLEPSDFVGPSRLVVQSWIVAGTRYKRQVQDPLHGRCHAHLMNCLAVVLLFCAIPRNRVLDKN